MKKAKTKPTQVSVSSYLDAITDPERRNDCDTLVELMSRITKSDPVMWGPSIVGFSSYHYKYASGHEGDSCLLGFASRKPDISVYVVSGFEGVQPILDELGKYKAAKGCLYIRRLSDINLAALEELLVHSVTETRKLYP